MSDRKQITWVLGGFIAVLLFILIAAAVPAYAGSWLQQVGRQQSEECAEGWGASWAAWAEPVTGGWVCSREVDDPSQPVAQQRTPPGPPPAPQGWTTAGSGYLAGGAYSPNLPIGQGLCTWNNTRLYPTSDPSVFIDYENIPNQTVTLHAGGSGLKYWEIQVYCI